MLIQCCGRQLTDRLWRSGCQTGHPLEGVCFALARRTLSSTWLEGKPMPESALG